jgi:hypothetical protein
LTGELTKPPGFNTKWVPLKRIDWYWDWQTKKTNDVWSLETGYDSKILNTDGIGIDDFVHPEWDVFYKPLDWAPNP